MQVLLIVNGNIPVNRPERASTGPVLGRCYQHRTSNGPVLAHYGMFLGMPWGNIYCMYFAGDGSTHRCTSHWNDRNEIIAVTKEIIIDNKEIQWNINFQTTILTTNQNCDHEIYIPLDCFVVKLYLLIHCYSRTEVVLGVRAPPLNHSRLTYLIEFQTKHSCIYLIY